MLHTIIPRCQAIAAGDVGSRYSRSCAVARCTCHAICRWQSINCVWGSCGAPTSRVVICPHTQCIPLDDRMHGIHRSFVWVSSAWTLTLAQHESPGGPARHESPGGPPNTQGGTRPRDCGMQRRSPPVRQANSRRHPEVEEVHEAAVKDAGVRDVGQQQRHVREGEGGAGGRVLGLQVELGPRVERRKHGRDAPRRHIIGSSRCRLPLECHTRELHERRHGGILRWDLGLHTSVGSSGPIICNNSEYSGLISGWQPWKCCKWMGLEPRIRAKFDLTWIRLTIH